MEVIGLQLDDVLIEKGAIMVRQGKGRKDRVTRSVAARCSGSSVTVMMCGPV